MRKIASFVGIDQGKKTLVLYARDLRHSWKKKCRIAYGDWQTLHAWLKTLPQGVMVAVEASYIYYPLVDRLIAWGFEARLANPRKLRLIYQNEKKTDMIDAMKLAQLLTTNDLPESYIPSVQERPDRTLLSVREHLIRQRTGLVNDIRARLRQFELSEPAGVLYSDKAITQLRKTCSGGGLDVSLAVAIEALVDALETTHASLEKIERRMAQRCKQVPLMAKLCGIEAIGKVGSFAFVTSLGNWERFGKSRQVARFAGLTPRTDISSDDVRYGRIDKKGPPILRRILTEITLAAIRIQPDVRAYHDWMCETRGKSRKKARVACSRKLIVGLWAAIGKGEAFKYSECFRIPGKVA